MRRATARLLRVCSSATLASKKIIRESRKAWYMRRLPKGASSLLFLSLSAYCDHNARRCQNKWWTLFFSTSNQTKCFYKNCRSGLDIVNWFTYTICIGNVSGNVFWLVYSDWMAKCCLRSFRAWLEKAVMLRILACSWCLEEEDSSSKVVRRSAWRWALSWLWANRLHRSEVNLLPMP